MTPSAYTKAYKISCYLLATFALLGAMCADSLTELTLFTLPLIVYYWLILAVCAALVAHFLRKMMEDNMKGK